MLIDGSTEDNDTLNTTLTGKSDAFTAQNIENINLNALSNNAALNFANVIGTNNVSITGTGNAALNNLVAATAPAIALNDYNSTATVNVDTLVGTEAAGTAESLSLTLNGTGAQAAVDLNTVTNAAEVLETLNIESVGGEANTVTLTVGTNVDGVEQHIVTGDTDLTIRADAAIVNNQEVDASALEGDLTLNLNFDAVGVNAAEFDGVNNYVARNEGSNGVNLFNIADGSTVTFADDFNASTITVAGAATGTDDSVSLVLDNDDTNAADVDVSGGLTIDNVENISIESTGAAADQQNSTGAISADSVETLTITGDSNFSGSLTVAAGEAGNITVDASAATGDVTFDAASVVDTAAGTRAVEITGGTGDDAFTSAEVTAATTFTGGEGDDTFNLNVDDSNDSITDFANGDTINVGDGANTAAFVNGLDSAIINAAGQANIEAAANVEEAAAAAAKALDANATNVNEALAFSYQGEQYVFLNSGVDATFDAAGDAVIGVTGLTDQSTFDAGTFNIA